MAQKWKVKRSIRPGLVYRSGHNLGRFMGNRVGKSVPVSGMLPVRGFAKKSNGFKSGFQYHSTKAFVEKNPKTVAAVVGVSTLGLIGVLHMTYQLSRGAYRMAMPKKAVV